MRLSRFTWGLCLVLTLCGGDWARAQKIVTAEPKPLEDVVNAQLKPVRPGAWRVPTITWGGDVATVLAQEKGIFREEGLSVELFNENDLTKAVQLCLDGQTPFLRGTMGMVNAAAPAFRKAGTELVVVYQMTWSTGGDALVVRENIKSPEDLRSAKIGVQLYGPHMDYLTNILTTASIDLDKATVRWYRDLFPPEEPGDTLSDPVSAFAAPGELDAAMCIIPNALKLTSNGTVGTGAEGSVKGAQILLTTKTASRIIADVYAVRKDFFDANRAKVESFVHGLLRAEEALRDLLPEKATRKAEYQKLLASSAKLLIGAAEATADVDGMLLDCEFVGHGGNVAFFTGAGTTRNLENLTQEIQTSFVAMKLMKQRVPLASAGWDYQALARGLKYVGALASRPRFDSSRATQKVEERLAAELESWEQDTLFVVEISFAPNQSSFPADQYQADFQKALEISQTYGGAIVIVEGHSDPLGVLRAKKEGKNLAEVSQLEQVAKNLSLARANAVRSSYLDYCKAAGITVDDSQFVAVGLGVQAPKHNPPRTKEEWAANRRVVFRIKQFEAELDEFKPLP